MSDRTTPALTPVDADAPRLVCYSTDGDAAIVLQTVVLGLIPDARVEAADSSSVRDAPDADCVILSVGSRFAAGEALARELRARGYAGGIVVVVEGGDTPSAADLAPLGIGAVIPANELAMELPAVLLQLLLLERRAGRSPTSRAALASLRRVQSLMCAAGLASTLQHKLNNPLAALLAEAQLLQLESLPREHAASVARIVELCRRVIDVTKTIEGIESAIKA
jgi:signal transduction histidine kinase